MSDALVLSAVNQLKAPVGSALMVPTSFNSSLYLDAGSVIDEPTYPALAAAIAAGFSGDAYTQISVPSFNGVGSSNGLVQGPSFVSPTSGKTFVLIGNFGWVYYTATVDDPSSLAYYTQLVTPMGSSVFSASFENNRLYVSVTNPSGGFGTYYVDLTATDVMTNWVAVTMPATTNAWRFKYANSTYLAFSNAATNVISSSSDGITFTATITTTIAASGVITGLDYGAGYWVASSTNTVAATCVSYSASASGANGSWAAATVGTTGYNAVKYSAGLSIWSVAAFSANGAFYTASVPTGTWTSRAAGTPAGSAALTKLFTTNNGNFVASSATQGTTTSSIQTSTDGTTYVNKAIVYPIQATAGYPLSSIMGCFTIANSIVVYGLACGSGANNPAFVYTTDNFGTLSNAVLLPGKPTTLVKTIVWLSDNLTGFAWDGGPTNSSANTPLLSGIGTQGLKTTNGGATWTPVTLPGTALVTATQLSLFNPFFFATPGKFCIIGNTTTVGGGASTSNVYVLTSTNLIDWTLNKQTTSVTMGTAGASSNGILFQSSGTTTAYKSLDYGVNWTTVTLPQASGYNVLANAIPNYLTYHSLTAGLYTSVDNGTTWVVSINSPFLAAATSAIIVSDGNGIVVGAVNNSVNLWVSQDGGLSFATRTAPGVATGISVNNGWILITNAFGLVFKSKDFGVTWVTTSNSLTSGLGYNWTLSTLPNGSGCYAIGAPSANVAYLLKFDATKKTIPALAPPGSGLKWVVRAK